MEWEPPIPCMNAHVLNIPQLRRAYTTYWRDVFNSFAQDKLDKPIFQIIYSLKNQPTFSSVFSAHCKKNVPFNLSRFLQSLILSPKCDVSVISLSLSFFTVIVYSDSVKEHYIFVFMTAFVCVDWSCLLDDSGHFLICDCSFSATLKIFAFISSLMLR